jgi:hypothetical protein
MDFLLPLKIMQDSDAQFCIGCSSSLGVAKLGHNVEKFIGKENIILDRGSCVPLFQMRCT